MQKSLEKKVFAYCNRHQMFRKGDCVVLGVSGGADSVCLLFVLLALQKEWDLTLHVVHVNHGIRPDAGEDAEYVKELCQKNQVPFYLVEKDIPSLATEWGLSEEETGRKVRYEAFEEILKKQKADKIAVAHNADDRAETMLFHMFRGTGLTGLGSIRPVREQVVRPLLCLEREEIEAYLTEKQTMYRHDSTNDSDDYTRNKIRHHILRYAKEEIVSGCVGNMNRTADILAETENYIEEQVNTALQSCVLAREAAFQLDCDKFLQLHTVIQKRILLRLLKELSPLHKDITATHIEDVHALFCMPGNRRIYLPYGICAKRLYERVLLERNSVEEPDAGFAEIRIDPAMLSQKELFFDVGTGGKLTFQLIKCEKAGINCKDIPQNQYTKWFDYDKIKECLAVRTRLTGDVLCINSPEGIKHKKLKDYMITEKILPQHRDKIPVLAQGSHVLWLVGYRISEYYKVTTETQNILQVSYTPNGRPDAPTRQEE